MTLKL